MLHEIIHSIMLLMFDVYNRYTCPNVYLQLWTYGDVHVRKLCYVLVLLLLRAVHAYICMHAFSTIIRTYTYMHVNTALGTGRHFLQTKYIMTYLRQSWT